MPSPITRRYLRCPCPGLAWVSLRFDTGNYNWHRYYDPSLGRYISADPIGQAGGINVYSYALNNPVAFIDPFGLDVINNSPNFVVVLPGGANESFLGDVKPSANDDLVCLASGETFEGSNDLVVNPATGEITKISNGLDATVNPDGSVSTTARSSLGLGSQAFVSAVGAFNGGSLSEADARALSPKFGDAVDEANALAGQQSPVGSDCACSN